MGRGLGVSLASVLLASNSLASIQNVFVNEICVDPRQDWNGDKSISPSDEWFEIYNANNKTITLDAMIYFIDTSPNARAIHTDIPAFGFYTILNPEGMQNNNGRIELRAFDLEQTLIDGFSYGNWPENNLGVPDGNSHGLYDETISRYVDGSNNFMKTSATYNSQNIPASGIASVMGLGAGLYSHRRRK